MSEIPVFDVKPHIHKIIDYAFVQHKIEDVEKTRKSDDLFRAREVAAGRKEPPKADIPYEVAMEHEKGIKGLTDIAGLTKGIEEFAKKYAQARVEKDETKAHHYADAAEKEKKVIKNILADGTKAFFKSKSGRPFTGGEEYVKERTDAIVGHVQQLVNKAVPAQESGRSAG
jgi:hypothetical protein